MVSLSGASLRRAKKSTTLSQSIMTTTTLNHASRARPIKKLPKISTQRLKKWSSQYHPPALWLYQSTVKLRNSMLSMFLSPIPILPSRVRFFTFSLRRMTRRIRMLLSTGISLFASVC
jgi:hypothetical protein